MTNKPYTPPQEAAEIHDVLSALARLVARIYRGEVPTKLSDDFRIEDDFSELERLLELDYSLIPKAEGK